MERYKQTTKIMQLSYTSLTIIKTINLYIHTAQSGKGVTPRGPGEQTGGETARVYGLIVVCFKSCVSISVVGEGLAGGLRMEVGRGRQSDIALKYEENRFINKKVSNLQFNRELYFLKNFVFYVYRIAFF